MAETSTFAGVLEFFNEVGLYDVVLPFILVFTIVFAILEKTKVLGTEEISGVKYTRKNLNVMIAFVLAFLVIASSQLVEIITQVSSQIVILLLMSVLFLLLIGSFFRDGEDVFLQKGWRTFFMLLMFVGIVFIFLGAIENSDGDSMLDVFWNYLSENGQGGDAVGSIVLLLILIVLVVYAIAGGGSGGKPSSDEIGDTT